MKFHGFIYCTVGDRAQIEQGMAPDGTGCALQEHEYPLKALRNRHPSEDNTCLWWEYAPVWAGLKHYNIGVLSTHFPCTSNRREMHV